MEKYRILIVEDDAVIGEQVKSYLEKWGYEVFSVKDFQNVLKEDTFQYPANQLKIQASQVYVKGDYVCFIMLGVLDNETAQQADEGKVIEAYKAENEKAVTAIDALF